MSPWTIVAIALCMSLTVTSMLAWDFGRRWLQEQKETRVSNETLNELVKQQALHEDVLKKLAMDWMKRFNQLENDWKKLKEHADSQFAGAIAQAEANQPRGFNRGY